MADLDADGKPDLITGCFEGGLYLLPGRAGGRFASPRPVLDRTGAVLRVGQYWDDVADEWAASELDLGISVMPVDWDADGDFDLLLGSNEGRVHLRRNHGNPQQPQWSETNEPVLADGAPLQVPGKHAMPMAADWDGDGRFDLVSGSASGEVVWFRQEDGDGEPRFAAPRRLVPPASGKADAPGARTQATVADWDGDGLVDLLVGDYRSRPDPQATNKRAWNGYVWLLRRLPADADKR